MKTLLKFSLIVTVLLSTLVLSCSKDDNEEEQTTDQTASESYSESYFTVNNAQFKDEDLPESSSSSSAPVIDDISGNTSVIQGGTNIITIESDSNFSYILIGLEGIQGYYRVSSSSLEVLTDIYMFYLSISQEFELNNFVIMIAIVDSNGLVSQYSEIHASTVNVGTGDLQVSLSWDQDNDVDLHLTEPNGETIYWGNSYSDNGGELDLDSNAACYIDGVENENITYSDEAVIESGEYIVGVDLWSNCSIPSNTNFIVTAHYGGQLISTTYGSNPYVGYLEPSDDELGTQTVMKFNISSLRAAETGQLKTIRFSYPSGTKSRSISPQKER